MSPRKSHPYTGNFLRTFTDLENQTSWEHTKIMMGILQSQNSVNHYMIQRKICILFIVYLPSVF